MKITKQMKKELVALVEFQSITPKDNLDKILDYLGKDASVSVETVTPEKYPMIAAVNRGSKTDSYVVKLNYDSDLPLTLVGKGVVYDSGGLYPKPYPSMAGMFNDKYGAMSTVVLAKHLKLPGIIFLNANLISDTSMVNGEIIPATNGLRVVVDHSDAEGRLGLADLLIESSATRPGTEMITMATLTGAAMMYINPVLAVLLHTHDLELQHKTLDGFYKGVMMFPSPHHKLYDDSVKSTHNNADISNVGSARGGGSQTAYSFLKNFSDEPIHHLDMAGIDSDAKGHVSGEGLAEILSVV